MNITAVKVVWLDAESTTEWTHIEDLTDLRPIHTLGYKVKESDTALHVAASIYADDKGKLIVGDTIAIPKAWIKEMYEIKEPVKKKGKKL